jgi:catechol 2,3-dioxygenase-like lactoylglutathione lyase family enzyme
MTAPPSDLLAYHLGFVVRDLHAAADRYQHMLGVDRWRLRELAVPKVPWDARSTDAQLLIGFGRAAGLTIELIQVREGRTPHLDFLETHGEGVQHIGIYTYDVRAAVEHAVSLGGRVTLARYDPNNSVVVQLTPASGMDAIVKSIDPGRIAYIDPGIAGVQFEFVGPAGAQGLREWMEDDFDRIVQPPPPWETSPAPAGARAAVREV